MFLSHFQFAQDDMGVPKSFARLTNLLSYATTHYKCVKNFVFFHFKVILSECLLQYDSYSVKTKRLTQDSRYLKGIFNPLKTKLTSEDTLAFSIMRLPPLRNSQDVVFCITLWYLLMSKISV